MSPHSDETADRENARRQIIGLGDSSLHKSHYPELQRKLEDLERYRLAFEESSDAMLLFDAPEGKILVANSAAEQLLGMSASLLEGRPVADFIADEALALSASTTSRSQRVRMRTLVRTAQGSTVPVEIGLRTTEYRSRSRCVVVVRDISDLLESEAELDSYRRHLEDVVEQRTSQLREAIAELESANRAKDRFLANMSHELRTPLNSVIGFSEVLLMGLPGELNDEQRRQLEMISRSGRHLLALISDILDIARIEAGRSNLTISRFGMADVVHDVSEMTRVLAEEKGLELRVNIAQDAEFTSDRAKLSQVLINLLSNAVKFTDEGVVTINADLDDNGLAVLEVCDQGPGIADEDAEYIMQEFTQLPDKRIAKPSGTGLGLAISRRLAQLLGGDLSVSSSVECGAQFTLRVPLVCPQGEE